MRTQLSPKNMVRSGLCIGCGSCVAQTNIPGAKMHFDAHGELKPHGPMGWYDRATENLARICPFSPVAKNEDEISNELFPHFTAKTPELGR